MDIQNYIVFDIETYTKFEKGVYKKPEFALCVLWDNIDEEFYTIWEDEINLLPTYFSQCDYTIGYNSKSYDMSILKATNVFPLNELEALKKYNFDIYQYLRKLKVRASLPDVSIATLNMGKLKTQYPPPDLYIMGAHDTLEDYCKQDVILTRDIFEHGLNYNFLRYKDRKTGYINDISVDFKPTIMGMF